MKTLVEQLTEISNNYPPREFNIQDHINIEIKYVENLLVEIAKTGAKFHYIEGLIFLEEIMKYFQDSGLKVGYGENDDVSSIYFNWE